MINIFPGFKHSVKVEMHLLLKLWKQRWSDQIQAKKQINWTLNQRARIENVKCTSRFLSMIDNGFCLHVDQGECIGWQKRVELCLGLSVYSAKCSEGFLRWPSLPNWLTAQEAQLRSQPDLSWWCQQVLRKEDCSIECNYGEVMHGWWIQSWRGLIPARRLKDTASYVHA